MGYRNGSLLWSARGCFNTCKVQKNLGGYFLHFSSSSTSMSAIKTVCSVCQFILSVTLLAQVGIIKISWFAWFAHSHGESKAWKGFTVL